MSTVRWPDDVKLAENDTRFSLVKIVTFPFCDKPRMFSCRPFGVWWSWWWWESEEEAKDQQKKSNYTGNIFLLKLLLLVLFCVLFRSGRGRPPLFSHIIIGAFVRKIHPNKKRYLARPYCVCVCCLCWTILNDKPMVNLRYLSRKVILWFVTRPHSWRCLVTQRLSPVYCGWIKARCAVQAGITPFEFGTSLLGLTNRRWYVCVRWQFSTC